MSDQTPDTQAPAAASTEAPTSVAAAANVAAAKSAELVAIANELRKSLATLNEAFAAFLKAL